MKHSIDYYIEHIEPMIDNLNRQQEIQIDNTKFSENKQIIVCMVNMFKYSYNLLNYTSSVYITYKKPSKLGVPHIRFITYIRKTTKKK